MGKDQTVPYGTDSRLNLVQAINRPATIIPSLRDEDPEHRSTNSTPDHDRPRAPHFEDEDEND
jgi:hypothetical protein